MEADGVILYEDNCWCSTDPPRSCVEQDWRSIDTDMEDIYNRNDLQIYSHQGLDQPPV